MDPRRFDALAKTLAGRDVSRRGALARLGAGGLAAALGIGGSGRLRAAPALRAQTGATCSLAVVANVRLGPSAGALLAGTTPGELRGDLEFAIGDLGAIEDGRLRLEDGAERPVVGQATGRALHLRVRLEDDEALVLVGTAEQDLGACDGPVGGLLTGPQAGDLGDWHATISAAEDEDDEDDEDEDDEDDEDEDEAGGAGAASAAPGRGAGTNPAPGPGGSPSPSPSPGSAGCPGGQERCGDECVDLASDVANCGACGNDCGLTFDTCVDGACVDPCGTVGLTNCSELCVDLATDPLHCGACGTACAADQVCQGGECACAAGLTYCVAGAAGRPVCVDTSSNPDYCGGCTTSCSGGGLCQGGVCACPAGWTDTAYGCVDTANDRDFCGAALVQCGAAQQCQGGVCV